MARLIRRRAAVINELARAANIIDGVLLDVQDSTRKDCEQAIRKLNQAMNDLTANRRADLTTPA